MASELKRFQLEADKRKRVDPKTPHIKPDLVNCEVFASATNSQLGDPEEKKEIE